jgi:hypothetical protein
MKEFFDLSKCLITHGLNRVWPVAKRTGVEPSFEKLDSSTEFRRCSRGLFAQKFNALYVVSFLKN